MPQDNENKPQIIGIPLSFKELDAIAEITHEDVNRAILQAPDNLKKFLLARLKDARKH